MDLPPAHFDKDGMQNRRLIVNGLSKGIWPMRIYGPAALERITVIIRYVIL